MYLNHYTLVRCIASSLGSWLEEVTLHVIPGLVQCHTIQARCSFFSLDRFEGPFSPEDHHLVFDTPKQP